MESAPRRFRCGAIGLGRSPGSPRPLEKCWRTARWGESESAPIPIAAGYSTTRPKPEPSAGATTAPAATAPASAAPGPHKSKKPDEENSSIARPADEFADLKLGILAAHER